MENEQITLPPHHHHQQVCSMVCKRPDSEDDDLEMSTNKNEIMLMSDVMTQ